MFTIVFITLLFFISPDSLVNGSEKEKIPDNGSNQNDWFFGLTNIPTLDWLYDQMYTPSQLNSNPEHESEAMKLQSEEIIKNLDQRKNKVVVDLDEISEERKSSKKVDDILDMIKESSDEEKKEHLPLLENLEDTINNNPARYVRVFLRNMWHVVDLGILNSGERRRNAEKVKSLYETIRDFIERIFNAIYDFITGRIEAGKRGAQKGWAAYERKKENDPREWTEEKATIRLHELESQYKTMNKEELAKDVTSLCMQPLFTVKFYEKIVQFMDRLKQEDILEKASLDKAFGYVDYKGKFAREHNIIEPLTEHDHNAAEKEKERHEAEKKQHDTEKEKEKHEGEKKEHKAD